MLSKSIIFYTNIQNYIYIFAIWINNAGITAILDNVF